MDSQVSLNNYNLFNSTTISITSSEHEISIKITIFTTG
jgi:hypothetical protein